MRIRDKGWVSYVAAVSNGTGTLALSAKLVAAIRAPSPAQVRAKLKYQLLKGKISQSEIRGRMAALEVVLDAYDKGAQTHVVVTDSRGLWRPAPSGNGHMRGKVTDYGQVEEDGA